MKLAIDAWQRRHAIVGFPYAVFKKFGDDQPGTFAAIIAYYAFFSIFPFLLLLVTILGIALKDHPDLQARVLN